MLLVLCMWIVGEATVVVELDPSNFDATMEQFDVLFVEIVPKDPLPSSLVDQLASPDEAPVIESALRSGFGDGFASFGLARLFCTEAHIGLAAAIQMRESCFREGRHDILMYQKRYLWKKKRSS